MYVSKLKRGPTPGNAIKAVGLGHSARGALAYRRPIAELLAAPLDSVGDGIFEKSRTVFGIGVLGTAAMPRSGFLAVFPVGWWLTRRARGV